MRRRMARGVGVAEWAVQGVGVGGLMCENGRMKENEGKRGSDGRRLLRRWDGRYEVLGNEMDRDKTRGQEAVGGDVWWCPRRWLR
jgi:hypothetical protein